MLQNVSAATIQLVYHHKNMVTKINRPSKLCFVSTSFLQAYNKFIGIIDHWKCVWTKPGFREDDQ